MNQSVTVACNSQWHLPHLQSDVAGEKTPVSSRSASCKDEDKEKKKVNLNHFKITCATVPLSRCSQRPTWWKYWRWYLSARSRPRLDTKRRRNKIPYLHYFGKSSRLWRQKLITSQQESISVVHLRVEAGIRFCFCSTPLLPPAKHRADVQEWSIWFYFLKVNLEMHDWEPSARVVSLRRGRRGTLSKVNNSKAVPNKAQFNSASPTWCYNNSWGRLFADDVARGVRVLRHVKVEMQRTVGLTKTRQRNCCCSLEFFPELHDIFWLEITQLLFIVNYFSVDIEQRWW